MKKIVCLLFVLLLMLSSCGRTEPQVTETEPATLTEAKTEPASSAVTEKETEEATEEETMPENVREEDGVLIYEAEDYSIKYPKGFTASYADGRLTLAPSEGAARYVTVEKTDTEFSDPLSSDETVQAVVSSLSGTLESEPERIELGGVYCVKFSFTAGGAYMTGYVFDCGGRVFVMCAASENKNDDMPARIAQTIKFNTKESSEQ